MRRQLRMRERIIEHERQGWKAVAIAYVEIRDLQLYHAEGFSDFGRYCRERLHVGKSTFNRKIAIGEVYKAVASTGAKFLPQSERQMRPLLSLREPNKVPEVWAEKVVEVWTKVVDDAKVTRKRITEKAVALTVEKMGFAPQTHEDRSKFDLDKRWAQLETQLDHEKEFWPLEQRRELCVRIVGLISAWPGAKAPASEPEEAEEPMLVNSPDEQNHEGKLARVDIEAAKPPSQTPTPPGAALGSTSELCQTIADE